MARREDGHQRGPAIPQARVALGAAMGRPVVHHPKDTARRRMATLACLNAGLFIGRDIGVAVAALGSHHRVEHPTAAPFRRRLVLRL